MSLDEKIRKTCSDIKVKDLNSEHGADILVNNSKSLFAKNINQAPYLAYDKYETFKRPTDMSMIDFINIKYEMELPTRVLAYRLLKSVEISEDKQQLARATLTSFLYECMKWQLKAIYDNLSQEISSLPLKVELVFKSKRYRKDGYYSKGANNSFNGCQGRSRTGRGGSQQNTDWRKPSKFIWKDI